MSLTPPEKIFSEFLLDPSNTLFPFLNELQRNPDAIHREIKQRSPKLPRVEWANRTGNGDGKIVFPEGTILAGTFKNFRLTEGQIQYPSGLSIKGRFRTSDGYMVDIFQSGTITFRDGTYAKVEFENLKFRRVEVFEKNNGLLGRLTDSDVLIVRPKQSNVPKRMDALTFTDEDPGLIGQDPHPVTYSYFGLFVHADRPAHATVPFYRRNPELVDVTANSTTELTSQEIEAISRYKNDDDSILRFEIRGFPGRFVLFVDDGETPSCGSGFYLFSDFVTPVALLPTNPASGPDAPSVFMVRNRPYSAQALKPVLRRLIDEQVISKFNSSQFHELEQTKIFTPKDAEFQQTLNRMVRKYEALQKQVDATKSENRARISHLININNALQKKNEELTSSEVDARNSRKRLESDIERHTATIRALTQEVENSRAVTRTELEKQRRAHSDLQGVNSRLQADLDGLKNSSKAKIDALIVEKTELLGKVRRMEEEVARLGQSAEKLREKVTEIEKEMSVLTKTKLQLEQIIAGKDQQETDMRNSLETLKNRNNQLTDNVKKLEHLKTCLMKDLEAAQQVFQKTADEKQQLQDSYGVYFFGTLKNGRKSGQCVFETSTAKLEGNFVNDRLHGDGTMTVFASQKVLQGDSWKEGVFVGKELCVGAVKYRGPILNNAMQGRGYFEFLNGFNLEANFTQDEIDTGKEVVLIDLSDGEEFRVQLAADKRTLVTANGRKWLMDFKTGNLVKN